MAPKAKPGASPRPKAEFKAKAAPKVSKAKGADYPAVEEKQQEPAAEAAPEPASDAAAAEEAAAEAGYAGVPLDVPAATEFIKNMSPDDMKALASSSDPVEQLPARMILEHVGEKDTSWKTAQASLKDGAAYKKEILDLAKETCASTQTCMDRLDALGKLNPSALKDKNAAAFAMAVFMEAVITATKQSLGGSDLRAKMQSLEGGDGPAKSGVENVDLSTKPEWPITIPFKQIDDAISSAWAFKKTPLILCCGKCSVVDTYLCYRSYATIDAKMYLSKVVVKKEMTIEEAREDIRKKLVGAMRNGRQIHIGMGNSAVAFKEQYCAPDDFPESLFNNELWLDEANYSKVIRPEDLEKWEGAFPGKMKEGCEAYSFITSDFTPESAQEHLSKALPWLDQMPIIIIDPSSIDSDS